MAKLGRRTGPMLELAGEGAFSWTCEGAFLPAGRRFVPLEVDGVLEGMVKLS